MTTEELKAEALRVKNAIAQFIEASKVTKTVIENLKAFKQENRKSRLRYEVEDLNGPAGRIRKKTLAIGGSFVEEYEAMEQLMNESTQLCDEIQLIPEEVDPIS